VADIPSDTADAAWSRRLASRPSFSLGLGWGPGQAIEGFWREAFAAVRPGSRVLEIGCGSADVSLWAAQADRGLIAVASDLHRNIQAVRRHRDVLFVGGARAEALPFADEAFDLVVSNFAVEYAAPDKALPELNRVLRRGGSAALVAHSADSIVTANSRVTLQSHEALQAAGVPEQVRRAAGLRADHLTRRKLLKQALRSRDAIDTRTLSFGGIDYFAVAERLLEGAAAARQELARLDEAVDLRVAISREQTRVALDTEQMRAFRRRLSGLGLAIDVSELTCTYEAGVIDKVGWIALLAKRP
jgi:SAM-dependent methyltransferase